MPRKSNLAPILRAAAPVLVLAALVYVIAVLRPPLTAAGVAWPIMVLVLSSALACVMLGLASVLSRLGDDAAAELSRSLSRVNNQLADLSARVSEVTLNVERTRRTESAATAPAAPAPANALTASDLEPLYQALREVRELTLLTDSERRDRLDRFRQERRANLIRQSFDLVAAREWHNAERLVLSMETEFPNDEEVAKARSYLNHARRLNESEAVAATVREVDQLLSMSAWDHAHAKARALVDGFPDNGEARNLLGRVMRERDTFQESTVMRMFDELRHDIDRRMWRRALLHAEHLLEKFPSHPRASGVRAQIKTLQDNAEIEERQELEVRIQELIRAQRFEEAIGLGEEVIRRYPASPQAESLETILPRLRELAASRSQDAGGANAFTGLGADIDDEIASERLG